MPTYIFKNKNTDEVFEQQMRISELDAFKKTNPDLEEKKEYKKVIKEVKIPEQITIQELSNRMAEKSNEIIKFLFIPLFI